MPPRGRPKGKGRGAASKVLKRNEVVREKRSLRSNDEKTEEREEELDESMKSSGDTSQSDNNEPMETNETVEPKIPKKRGRKRKSELIQEEKEKATPPADTTQRGIASQGTSLRRRDASRSTSWRYSPPPATTRRSLKADKTPTPNEAKKEERETSPTENATSNMVRKKSIGARMVAPAAEKTKSTDNMVVTMPDGFDMKVEPPKKKAALVDSETEYVPKDPSEESDKEKVVDDSDSKTRGRIIRRKSTETNIEKSDKSKSPSTISVGEKSAIGGSTSTPVTMSKTQTITIPTTTQSISMSKIPAAATTTATSATGKSPTILKTTLSTTPVLSNVAKTQSVRKPASLSKYLETLPEINDCIHNDGIADTEMEKLPDKILLVNSELPLGMAVSIDNENENYLFRQIISPVSQTRFVCLLCKGIDVNFGTKEEKDILLHYQSLHELDVEIGQAKFSEDIVFICLPKMILNQFSNSNSLSLNSPCQYCEVRLSDITEMKEHYSNQHQKEVIMMEQEEIMQMHHYFYCCKCKEKSSDFDSHHKHMKTHHNLKTYRCKSCVLVTRDENRLRTHFKAKHMLHSSGQNYQCYYCHGLLIGVERLQKHIQQSHMVQTGVNEYSCVACRNRCGKGKELLTHAQNCEWAGIKPEKSDLRFVPQLVPPLAEEGERVCYFCNVKLESEEAYQLHLHHEHKKWVSDVQTVLNQNQEPNELLTIDEVINDDDLKRAEIKTYVGHWCRICDQMVKVYQLYYLHMVNYHKLQKMFQCVISACKKTFVDFDEFQQHIEETGHLQKTIISHPDEVFVCAYCDIYFASDDELTAHLITDQHINKFTASGHFHRTEPRNFKCKACQTFFGMKESYIHHLETESHQYVCTYCGITTATPSSRRAHIQNTHPEKLLLCEDCGECQNDIAGHFVYHGYTFECKKCIKKFYNRERLNAHMEVHQDPIECNWPGCNRNIATRSMLVTHYRGHKSDHKCAVCGQAFWNFAMLTSHLRSHQPMPQTPIAAAKANQVGRAATFQYQPRSSPSVLQRPRPQPVLSNSVIKCGHCNNLFRSTKELSAHRCIAKCPLNNGDQSKLLELAKASAQAKAMNKPSPRRRASPKKTATQPDHPMPDFSFPSSLETHAPDESDDTQLIMILNQSTGELMEITAPKGMEVQEVINSLQLTPALEEVQMEAVEEPTQQQPIQITEQQQEESEQNISKDQNEQQQETNAAIEVIEQVNDQTSIAETPGPSTEVPVSTDPSDQVTAAATTTESTESEILIQDNGEQISHQIIEDPNSQEQAIVLPPDCINEDGSVTIDAETFRRLNLAFSMDDNGTITTTDGAIIIDTSHTIKE